MRIRNLLMIGLLASGGLAVTSCKKAPFQEMTAKHIAPVVTERIDSIAQASKQILANKNYQKFAEDTLELTKDFFNNPAKFIEKLNKHSVDNIPETCTGSYTTTQQVYNGSKLVGIIPVKHHIYTDNFINTKTVINSKKIFTRDGDDMFIPVEYYGIPNPKLQNKQK